MKPSEDSSLPERKPPQPWINVGKRKAKRIKKKGAPIMEAPFAIIVRKINPR